jgi:7-cyano-7-deazaguanine synthase
MNILLLSGGMDSALILSQTKVDLAVGFDYGQPHVIELGYAERLAARYGVPFQKIMLPRLPLVDDVVFAGRNAVMLSFAASLTHGGGKVLIGCNKDDAERFADCRLPFLVAMNEALAVYGVTVAAPLLHLTKREIVARAAGLDTWTCYSPKHDFFNDEYVQCGECRACRGIQ